MSRLLKKPSIHSPSNKLGFMQSPYALALSGLLAMGAAYFAFSTEFSSSKVGKTHSGVAETADLPEESELNLARAKLRLALTRANLTPEHLAAAGVSTSSVTALVSTARAWMAINTAALDTAETAARNAKIAVARLEQLQERGLASADQRTELGNARTTLASSQARLATLIGNLKSSATAALTEQQLAKLGTLEGKTQSQAPVPLRLGAHTEAEEVALRNISANKRIADRIGEAFVGEQGATEFEASDQMLITNYEESLPLVREAWLDATGT